MSQPGGADEAGKPFLFDEQGGHFEVAKLLSRRVQMVSGYLVDLKHQFADKDDHFAIVDEVLESLVHHQGVEAEPGSDRHPDPTVESHAPPGG